MNRHLSRMYTAGAGSHSFPHRMGEKPVSEQWTTRHMRLFAFAITALFVIVVATFLYAIQIRQTTGVWPLFD